MDQKRYVVSVSPHLRQGRTIRSMVLLFAAALLPAAAWGVYQFGLPALVVLLCGVGGAVGTEALMGRVTGQGLTVKNGHAALVGLVLALLLPPGAPWWLALLGASLGILVGKLPFGPLGGAPLNPALVGVLIVAISWPDHVNAYRQPLSAPEAVRGEGAAPAEHPLSAVHTDPSDVVEYDARTMFLGHQVGPIGGISPLLLLLGGLFLIWRRVIRWQAPAGFLLGVFAVSGIAAAVDPMGSPPAWFHLTTGLVVFGGFFLCTDWSSTPVSPWGLFLFAFSAGALSVVLRMTDLHFGRVPWAIVIVSLATPLFDRIAQAPFGKVVRHA
jgi:electron transport complex protein RnfD